MPSEAAMYRSALPPDEGIRLTKPMLVLAVGGLLRLTDCLSGLFFVRWKMHESRMIDERLYEDYLFVGAESSSSTGYDTGAARRRSGSVRESEICRRPLGNRQDEL